MKLPILVISAIAGLFLSPSTETKRKALSQPTPAPVNIVGTWQLVSGLTISGKDSTLTDYTKDQQMIKIINNTHFAFLKHALNVPKDSANQFDAGGGRYTLTGNRYTEHLDYYNDRHWEGKTFDFTVQLKKDTLIQSGLEKVEGTGIDRTIIEKYVRAH